MKKVLLSLMIIALPLLSQAQPRPDGYRGGYGGGYHERGGGPFFFPLPLFIPAPIIIHEEPRYSRETIREEIEVKSRISRNSAKNKWEDACDDWSRSVRREYSRVEDSSCGEIHCTYEGDGTVCYSSARATVLR